MIRFFSIYLIVYLIEIFHFVNPRNIFFVTLFQAAEEEMIDETKPFWSAEMKSGSEVLRNMNDGQGKYDGMTVLFWH